MVYKKLAYSVKKDRVAKYYKSYLHWCIIAWVGAYGEEMSTRESWINTAKAKNCHINALQLKSILLSLMLIARNHGIYVKFFQIVLPQKDASTNWADPTQNSVNILQNKYGNG